VDHLPRVTNSPYPVNVEPKVEDVDDLFAEIVEKISKLPNPHALQGHDEFMTAGVDAMDSLLSLGKLSVCLRRPKARGYSRRHAPIVGLMVRMIKLFEGILTEIVEHRSELAEVFNRPLYEAHVKLEYLIRSPRESVVSFMKTGFRAEKEMLAFLNEVKTKRRLIPIEVRMRRSILNHVRLAGMSQAELRTQKTWELSMRSLLTFLKRDREYSFRFGVSSHALHGTWPDLWLHHLQRIDGRFQPEIRYGPADPRYIGPPGVLLTESLRSFLRYFRLDRTSAVLEAVGKLDDYFKSFGRAWEQRTG
jgi:hypothetical protein